MLHRLSVGNKLNMLLIAALLGVMAISGLALYSKYQRMLDDARYLGVVGAYFDRIAKELA